MGTMMHLCPVCSFANSEGANYCSRCGTRLPEPTVEPPRQGRRPRVGWGMFLMTLLLSLALSVVLSMVFHMPVFLLGLFLPLAWPLLSKPR